MLHDVRKGKQLCIKDDVTVVNDEVMSEIMEENGVVNREVFRM